LEALLARKKQFEGPKSCLEYLEGAAGPKVQFEGPKSYLEYLEGAAGPKGQFEGPKSYLEYLVGAAGPKRGNPNTISNKNSLEGANVPRKTESSKNSVYIRMVQKRGAQKTSKETQSRGRLSARGTYLWDSKEFPPISAL
jgi:hypothetical protein